MHTPKQREWTGASPILPQCETFPPETARCAGNRTVLPSPPVAAPGRTRRYPAKTAPLFAAPPPGAAAPEHPGVRRRLGSPCPPPWYKPGEKSHWSGDRWAPGCHREPSSAAVRGQSPGLPAPKHPPAAGTAGSHKAALPERRFHPPSSHHPSAPGNPPPATSASPFAHRLAWPVAGKLHRTGKTTQIPAPSPNRPGRLPP